MNFVDHKLQQLMPIAKNITHLWFVTPRITHDNDLHHILTLSPNGSFRLSISLFLLLLRLYFTMALITDTADFTHKYVRRHAQLLPKEWLMQYPPTPIFQVSGCQSPCSTSWRRNRLPSSLWREFLRSIDLLSLLSYLILKCASGLNAPGTFIDACGVQVEIGTHNQTLGVVSASLTRRVIYKTF